MSEEKVCPSCDGKKGWEYDPNPYWMDDPEFMKPKEWRNCHVCEGKGSLSPLPYACYVSMHAQPPTEPVKFD